MRKLGYLCSAILIAIALIGYFGWEMIGGDKQSPTALIPIGFGLPMLIGSLIARKNTKVGIHIAVLFSLLGAVAGLGRLIPTLAKGGEVQASTIMIAVMAVVCLVFTIAAVRSFIAARRARS